MECFYLNMVLELIVPIIYCVKICRIAMQALIYSSNKLASCHIHSLNLSRKPSQLAYTALLLQDREEDYF